METRRTFLIKVAVFAGFAFSAAARISSFSWAVARKLLPKGIPKEELIQMNPEEVDNRDLPLDPVDRFGTMGPTDVEVNPEAYRLKISGKVDKPLSLTVAEIRQYPSTTRVVLLICSGFFANNGRWTGVSVDALLKQAKVKEGANFVEVRGAEEKAVKIPLPDLEGKEIFLAYAVNGETLPRKYGFPLRLVWEDHYGYDWVKYVDEIVVS